MSNNIEPREKEILSVVKTFSKFRPGHLPQDVFYEVARTTVTPVIEVVPLRRGVDASVRALLFKRSASDKNWPDMHYIPGTIITANDSLESALHRVLNGCLTNVETTDPIFVKNTMCATKRGVEIALVYFVEVKEEPLEGSLHDILCLPEKIIEGHKDFIGFAADKFRL